jgi:SpoIID/LytB domain protein
MRVVVPFLLMVLLAAGAGAQEKMTREDAAAILFSNSFSFTRDGQPVLSVGLMAEQQTVEFTAPAGLAVHPSGPGGPSATVSGNRRWKATVSASTPAKVGYRAVLAAAATRDFPAVKALAADWKQRGVDTVTLELGTLFSFEGTVFDTRKTLVCSATAFESAGKAQAFVDEVGRKFPGSYLVQEVLLERPSGLITLATADGSVRFEARNAVWFEPAGGALTVHDVEFAKGFSWHGRQTRKYSGSFYLAVDRHGSLAIANVLPAEQLLKGLVPAEIFPDAPREALKAQAVTARVEMLAKIGHRHLADPFRLCADQHCQVYKGLDAERAASTAAVEATAGQVLFEASGTLLDARYHSTCGGHTETASFAWPGVDSTALQGRFENRTAVKDVFAPLSDADVAAFLANPPPSYCGRSSRAKATFRWSKSISSADMDKMLAKAHDVGRVTAVSVTRRGVSGRAVEVEVRGTGATVTIKGELTIRQLFGGLKSSLFVVSPTADAAGRATAFTFSGGGFGHGVGMCQIGATEMAKDGKSYKDILEYYYRNVQVRRIY